MRIESEGSSSKSQLKVNQLQASHFSSETQPATLSWHQQSARHGEVSLEETHLVGLVVLYRSFWESREHGGPQTRLPDDLEG